MRRAGRKGEGGGKKKTEGRRKRKRERGAVGRPVELGSVCHVGAPCVAASRVSYSKERGERKVKSHLEKQKRERKGEAGVARGIEVGSDQRLETRHAAQQRTHRWPRKLRKKIEKKKKKRSQKGRGGKQRRTGRTADRGKSCPQHQHARLMLPGLVPLKNKKKGRDTRQGFRCLARRDDIGASGASVRVGISSSCETQRRRKKKIHGV